MTISEGDAAVLADNYLTNLPISKLSSIPTAAGGVEKQDLLLISKLCDGRSTTDTGYMSYKVTVGALANWMVNAFDIDGVSSDVIDLQISAKSLIQFYDMLCDISNACPSAVVDLGNNYENGNFNPYVISAICSDTGTIISNLGGYRFADAMSSIFSWKTFGEISAISGHFDSANITSLSVNGQLYQQLSVMKQSEYDALPQSQKPGNCFYFTYS